MPSGKTMDGEPYHTDLELKQLLGEWMATPSPSTPYKSIHGLAKGLKVSPERLRRLMLEDPSISLNVLRQLAVAASVLVPPILQHFAELATLHDNVRAGEAVLDFVRLSLTDEKMAGIGEKLVGKRTMADAMGELAAALQYATALPTTAQLVEQQQQGAAELRSGDRALAEGLVLRGSVGAFAPHSARKLPLQALPLPQLSDPEP